MTNTVFNKLAKCDENYFETESEKILDREMSLKETVENFQVYMETEKAYAALSQISGYHTKQQLMAFFPGKFDLSIIKKFIGAEIKGKQFFKFCFKYIFLCN